MAAAIALLAAKASAATNPPTQFTILSVSGTASFEYTNYDKLDKKGTNVVDTNIVYVAKSMAFNNKTIYSIISNAVANATNYSANLISTNVPPDGYIAFNPNYDGGPEDGGGFFYVTNKSGFFLPLSGVGAHDTYYSFIELDTYIPAYGEVGFGNNFDDSYNSAEDFKTGNGSLTAMATGLLYIHDDPLSFDDSDNTYEVFNNNTAIEIRGILKLSLTVKDGNITANSASLSGTGNYVTDDDNITGEVISGDAKLTK